MKRRANADVDAGTASGLTGVAAAIPEAAGLRMEANGQGGEVEKTKTLKTRYIIKYKILYPRVYAA